MKKLLLGTLISLGITTNEMALQGSYCYDRSKDLMCVGVISIEILIPVVGLFGASSMISACGDHGNYEGCWFVNGKAEAALEQIDLFNSTGTMSGELNAFVEQVQTQVAEKTGKELSVEDVMREIEFQALR